ncbi:MAG: hypothetical protein VYD70_04880 [Planctomycetota bacterium]|nr:hypothetical protein [Planctomycetota bacterium]
MSSSNPILSFSRVVSAFFLGAVVAAMPLSAQDNPDYQFSIGSGAVSTGNSVDISVTLDSSGELIAGWAIGVCTDPNQLQIVGLEMGATSLVVNGGSEVDFRIVNIQPDGFQVAVLIDISDLNFLLPGNGYELEVVTYSAVATAGSVATLQFCDTLGNPPIANQVVLASGAGVTPIQVSGTLDIVEVTFIRGDIDQDGRLTIADPISLLTILFIGGTDELNCDDARDANNDARIDLADAIYLLSYQFGNGPIIPAPFPDCGSDPTADDALSCDSFAACP